MSDELNIESENTEQTKSPVIVATAIGLYLIVVIPMMIWLGLTAIRMKFDVATIVMLTVPIALMGPLLNVGVFAAYRASYLDRRSKGDLGDAARAAVAWERYAFPLCFFNLVWFLFSSLWLSQDIIHSGGGRFVFGSYELYFAFGKGVELSFPTSLFYWAYLGFAFYYLDISRRRYLTDNLVPHFYISLALRWMYVPFASVTLYVLITVLSGGTPKPEVVFLLSVAVGIFLILTDSVVKVRSSIIEHKQAFLRVNFDTKGIKQAYFSLFWPIWTTFARIKLSTSVNSPVAGAPELRPGALSAELDSEDGAFTPPSDGGAPAPLHPQGQPRPLGRGFALP